MSEQSVSALEAIRSLRSSIETRLHDNEDYRALKALDRALTQLSEPKLPKVRQLQEQAEVAAQAMFTAPARPAPPQQTSAVDPPKPNLSPRVATNPPAEAESPMSAARRLLATL